MRRKNFKRNTSPVSLFSFLDILGGTIGVLTLIIAVFLIQMSRGNQIVQMVSDGQNFQNRTASYIICNGGGQIELHDGGSPQSTTISSPLVTSFLTELSSDGNRYLILGVRPDGFDDFERLRDRAEEMSIIVGYEPLDKGWRIRAPGGDLL